MKKILLTAITCVITATSAVFGQHTQSLSFSGPGPITPGNPFTLSVNLTYAGYSSPGLSFWFEVNQQLAPFISIVSHTNFTFTDPNNVNPKPAPFNLVPGATAGFMTEPNDMGGTTNPNMPIPPGTYHVTDVTFMLDAAAPLGNYTLASTILSPKISEVSDTDLNDNPIPRATFSFGAIPEPSTLALLSLAAVGSGLVAYRRRKAAR